MQHMRYSFLVIVFIFVTSMVQAAQSFIILASDPSKTVLQAEEEKYRQFIDQNPMLQKVQKREQFSTQMRLMDDVAVLKVGPFKSGDGLALAYLSLRAVFPQAFISEDIANSQNTQPKIQYVTKEVVVEKEDETLWTALFGLAIIGILALFLSSDQIKNLNQKHSEIQERQIEIEKKQSLLLEKMGEKIQTVALENVNNEKKLLETSLESIDKKEIKTHIGKIKQYDEDLLRTTYEMIDFLKIKSGNIVIKQEAFQLSNLLHKLTNAVAPLLNKNAHTLQYDISSNVTRYLVGDTVRIYQILHNLLANVLEYEKKSEVLLRIEVKNEEQLIFTISSSNQYLVQEEIDRLFVPVSWEELQRSNKEFGFFVLNELISNMDGELLVQSNKKGGTQYIFSLPYIHDVDSKSHRDDLKKLLFHKKAMVIDSNPHKAEILTEILQSFDMQVVFHSSDSLAIQRPSLEGIDFLIVKAEDISQKVYHFFKDIDKKHNLDIIVIYNIHNMDKNLEISSFIADVELYSPLVIGDVEEGLKQLCLKKERKKKEKIREELKHFRIQDVVGVNRSDFRKFIGTVLIVEDNLVSQQVLHSMLSASNLEIHRVENGIQAVKFLETHDHVDLIFMDMDMPVMDGFEATKKIRKHYIHKDVPIVSVTGLGFNYEMEQMILSGVNACITKPFKVGQLYVALEKFLKAENTEMSPEKKQCSQYPQKQDILDVNQGIKYVRSESFYREIVAQVALALRNSDQLVKEMIQKNETDALKAFCIDTLGLSATIGASSFVKLLNQMLEAMADQEDLHLSRFIDVYKQEWFSLEEEMRRYIMG